MSSLEELREQWRHLYAVHLPELAKARDAAQKYWPVFLDHCFARIILDNAVGKDGPWTAVIKAPAVKNMSESQLLSAVDLAQRIATGEADLVTLDEHSLALRGKASKEKRKAVGGSKEGNPKQSKRVKKDASVSSYFIRPTSDISERKAEDRPGGTTDVPRSDQDSIADISAELERIKQSSITPFRKQTLSLLCQIPRGRYSTYGAISDFVTETSHKTCARAIGNAMRNNPFAPEVPCHRVLAGDGSLGGFKGGWGEEGKYAGQKHELLKEEGVKFDSTGKVKGPPFRDFTAVL